MSQICDQNLAPVVTEYNIAGAMFCTFEAYNLAATIRELTLNIGFDGVTIMPFRGYDNYLPNMLAGTNVHLEDAWYPTKHDGIKGIIENFQASYDRIGNTTDESLLPFGIFFPDEFTSTETLKHMTANISHSVLIGHTIADRYKYQLHNNRFLLEICPLNHMSPEKVVEVADVQSINLVFDPTHLISNNNSYSARGSPTREKSSWEEQFNYFSQTGRIEVVDLSIRSNKAEVKEFIDTTTGKLNELVDAALELSSVRVLRAEMPVPLLQQISGKLSGKARDHLQNVNLTMKTKINKANRQLIAQ